MSDTYIILSYVPFALRRPQSTGISVARLYLRVSASVCEYVRLFYARFMQKLTHAVDSLPSFKTCRSVSTSSLSVYTHSHTHKCTHIQCLHNTTGRTLWSTVWGHKRSRQRKQSAQNTYTHTYTHPQSVESFSTKTIRDKTDLQLKFILWLLQSAVIDYVTMRSFKQRPLESVK